MRRKKEDTGLKAFNNAAVREGITYAEAQRRETAAQMKRIRPPHEWPENFPEVYNQWKNKEISVSEAARLCGFARATFHDKSRKYEEFENLVKMCRRKEISQSEAARRLNMPLSSFRYRAGIITD